MLEGSQPMESGFGLHLGLQFPSYTSVRQLVSQGIKFLELNQWALNPCHCSSFMMKMSVSVE